MSRPRNPLAANHPRVAGSVGTRKTLAELTPAAALASCDLVEIRLDLLAADGAAPSPALWRHLAGVPLLFTARRPDEGGAPDSTPEQRAAWLEATLDDAALVDVELASADEMADLLDHVAARSIPWVASFHDFGNLPETALLEDLARRAEHAGAAVFKIAARLNSTADMVRLAAFQRTAGAIPFATMGMGPLAPVSRLLGAQCGSVLNFGYIGETATAPGQWEAAFLKPAIARLAPFPG